MCIAEDYLEHAMKASNVIYTERCILDRPTPTDRDDVIRLQTDSEVRRFLGGSVKVARAESRFLQILESDLDRYWAVRLKSDHMFVGLISLSSYHNQVDTEVSYEFLPEFWGNGFAAESVGAVIALTLEDASIDRIVAETQAVNLPSRRLLERLGMHEIGSAERFGEKQVIYSTCQD